jgi:aminoglycoside/choline kinase family phosphotransferase
MTSANNGLNSSAHDFLTQTLGTATKFEVIPLAGDASSRRYFRIVSGEDSNVLMVWEPFVDDGRYPFLNVQAHFAKHGVQVPTVVAKAPKLGLVLLEDLGDLTLERKFWENQNQSLALPYYKKTIDELIKMHYLASRDSKDSCVAFEVSFNVEKLLWEMNYGLEHLIEKFCRVNLGDKVRRELTGVFTQICTKLHEEPKVICHRDYHSRNVMLKLGKTRVIDFQDARLGPIQYDLVSLVHDSYVDMADGLRGDILDYYLAQAQDHHAKPIVRDEFDAIFSHQMIQRCFKACGSFASFYNTREDLRYLKYLSPTVAKVAKTLERHPEYSLFLKIIRDNGLLERDYLNPTATQVRG